MALRDICGADAQTETCFRHHLTVQIFTVSYTGTVKNGVVILPPEAKLPDGTAVEVKLMDEPSANPPFLQELLKLAKDRDWPSDFALNHAHYAKGHPKKA